MKPAVLTAVMAAAIVPDPAASARFYARIFKSALHQQPVRDTLRYFVN